MKKIAVLIMVGMFCLLNVWVYADDKNSYIGKSDFYLIGSINNKYLIQMQLFQNKNNEVDGTYFYESMNKPIQLSGTLKNGVLVLEEKDPRGQTTAVFDGKLVSNQIYSGIWHSKVSQKQYPFRVEQIWRTGEWERIESSFSPAKLSIIDISDGLIDFGISASSGGNLGNIDGKARINGNIARYKNQETGAEVTLINNNNAIEVKTNEATQNYCGVGVEFDGSYQLGPLKEKTPTLHEMGYFASTTQDQLFHKLVKNDYDSFVLNLQSYDPDSSNDVDNLKAKVISGCVSGIPSYRAIIMYTKDNKFWAAVTKDHGINYYTNTPMKIVPKTIQAWAKIVQDHLGDATIHWVK